MDFGAIPTADVMVGALLLAALYTDLTRQKVPNQLNFGGMILGLAVGVTTGHFADSILGILAAFALMFPGWRFGRAIRGGDAKLLMAIGAFYGPADVFRCCLLTYVLNIPFGLGVLLLKGRLGNLRKVYRARIRERRGLPPDEDEKPELTVIAFVPVIVVAVVVARTTEVFKWF